MPTKTGRKVWSKTRVIMRERGRERGGEIEIERGVGWAGTAAGAVRRACATAGPHRCATISSKAGSRLLPHSRDYGPSKIQSLIFF